MIVQWLGLMVIATTTVFAAESFAAIESKLPDFQQEPVFQLSTNLQSQTQYWSKAVEFYQKEKQNKPLFDALMNLGESYQQIGNVKQALDSFQQASYLAETIKDSFRSSMAQIALGNVFFLLGESDKAVKHLNLGIDQARDGKEDDALSAGLISLANLLASQKQYEFAQQKYQNAYQIASNNGNAVLASKALINASKNSLFNNHFKEAEKNVELALKQVKNIKDAHAQAKFLLAGGEIAIRLGTLIETKSTALKLKAFTAFSRALEIAELTDDDDFISVALGNLAWLFQDDNKTAEALSLTHRAAFAAQKANAPDLLSRWQRQQGQLLATMKDFQGAVAAYRQASQSIMSVRQGISNPHRLQQISFRDGAGSMFLEYADVLLRLADGEEKREEKQAFLKEARDAVEHLKSAELKDYLQDDCVAVLQAKIKPLNQVVKNTAVIYPILLEDRMEILLTLSDGIERVKVAVDKKTLTQEVRSFRRRLEKPTTRQFMLHAWKLYDWLIRPLQPILQASAIDTLIFVPDGSLRTIPFAALHDREQFLIQQFAVASTPGLTLMDPRPFSRQENRILASGITESVGGFAPLPFVKTELKVLQELYEGQFLVDENFLLDRMQNELNNTPYNIVHIASHGQFNSDPRETFLLTFDAKLTMDKLEQFIGVSKFRENPVELLTLSACETAAGDDRAALGLAGVALKAGARSALATLWVSNDEASATLVSEFYRQLKSSGQSKAKALQKAQLTLIEGGRFRHPVYWSPFILIGNWL